MVKCNVKVLVIIVLSNMTDQNITVVAGTSGGNLVGFCDGLSAIKVYTLDIEHK